MTNIEHWNIQDPMPGVALDAIEPLSQRAWVLMTRNRQSPVLALGFVNVAGAIEMMTGMDYHHDNFVRIVRGLVANVALDDSMLNHEAVAYINRLGQFRAFAKSELVKSAAPDALAQMPVIESLMVFRDKHTAHRSMDVPKPSDTDEMQWAHARSLSTLGGRIWVPRPDMAQPSAASLKTFDDLRAHIKRLWKAGFVSYQIFDERKNDHINFAIERDHPVIACEAYSLIKRLVLSPRS